jgi:hypothetical protein
MAGLPEVKEDAAMLDAHAGGEGGGAEVTSGVATPVPEGAVKGGGPVVVGGQMQQSAGGGGGQGGKKGKKKGKK